MANKMKPEEALSIMQDIESSLVCLRSQLDIAIMNGWDGQKVQAISDIARITNRATEIYEKFKNGCGKDVNPAGTIEYPCGLASLTKPRQFCYDCKEIRDIYDALVSGGDE